MDDESDAFLECGILAHGFLRPRCPGCSHEKLVAFSCKRRGFLPLMRSAAYGGEHSSHGRSGRPARTGQAIGALFAAQLGILFAAHPELLSRVLRIIHRVVATYLIKQAGKNVRTPTPVRSHSSSALARPPIGIY